MLGFDAAAGGDEVFRDLVLARIIEPTSKVDSLRVLDETGVVGPSYPTLNRRLPRIRQTPFPAGTLGCVRYPRRTGSSLPWCSTTCPRCTSKPMPVMGSECRDSPRNAGTGPADHHRAAHRCGRVPVGPRQTQPLHPPRRRHQKRQPGLEGQNPRPGQAGRDTPTNLTGQPAQFVIDAYHQLWRIEKAFRMSKHDLQARPIYHRTRDSIDAHLTVVFAALAVSPLGRAPNGLEHQEIRPISPPLPHPHPSKPDATPSSPPNPHPTTSPKHSSPSTATVLRARLIKGRSLFVPRDRGMLPSNTSVRVLFHPSPRNTPACLPS